jgi:hypothetical protein
MYQDMSFQLHCYNSTALVLGWSHVTPLLLHNQAYSVASTVGRKSVINDFFNISLWAWGIKVAVLSAYCLIFIKV